ncbi:MAG: hypothetical protein HYT21_02565 [Candidatus Nealsonbacteria bacterium]|nr:hypothetical protein [Candidatus Nealsonbacteria bacterium]
MDAILERLNEIQERFAEIAARGKQLQDMRVHTDAGRAAIEVAFSEISKEQDRLCKERLELIERREVLAIQAIWPGTEK